MSANFRTARDSICRCLARISVDTGLAGRNHLQALVEIGPAMKHQFSIACIALGVGGRRKGDAIPAVQMAGRAPFSNDE